MAVFHVQRVERRYGDHNAIYREVVLTGLQAGQPVRVVLQLPWASSPAYAVGDAVELTWTTSAVVAPKMQIPAVLVNDSALEDPSCERMLGHSVNWKQPLARSG